MSMLHLFVSVFVAAAAVWLIWKFVLVPIIARITGEADRDDGSAW
jgi:hypothetical protein